MTPSPDSTKEDITPEKAPKKQKRTEGEVGERKTKEKISIPTKGALKAIEPEITLDHTPTTEKDQQNHRIATNLLGVLRREECVDCVRLRQEKKRLETTLQKEQEKLQQRDRQIDTLTKEKEEAEAEIKRMSELSAGQHKSYQEMKDDYLHRLYEIETLRTQVTDRDAYIKQLGEQLEAAQETVRNCSMIETNKDIEHAEQIRVANELIANLRGDGYQSDDGSEYSETADLQINEDVRDESGHLV